MSNAWAGIKIYSLLQSSWPLRGKQNTEDFKYIEKKGPWKTELLFYSVLFYCSIERATVLFVRIGYSFRVGHWYRSTFSFHFNSCLSCPYQWANIYNHFPLRRIKWVWEAGMCPACYSWSVQKNGTGNRWLARHTLT